MPKSILIVPCFNESERLSSKQFKEAASDDFHIIFANDGSNDSTAELLEDLCKDEPFLHFFNNKRNKGKAGVIFDCYQSMDFSEFDYIGYWDADLATPLWEVENMINYAKSHNNKFDAIWGSRVLRLGADIQRSPTRHYFGRVFASVIGLLLNVKSYDSQCGAKLFNQEAAKIAFRDPFMTKWIFDVEILLRLKDFSILEYPLRQWRDVPGSKVKISRDIFRVLKDIFKLWKKYH